MPGSVNNMLNTHLHVHKKLAKVHNDIFIHLNVLSTLNPVQKWNYMDSCPNHNMWI